MDPGVVIAIVLGLPACGFAARLVVKPMADAYTRSRELKAMRDDGPAQQAQAQRVAQLEAEVTALREDLARLSSIESFYAQLQAPAAGQPLPATAPPTRPAPSVPNA